MVAITAFSTLLPVHLHAQITSTNTSPAVSGGTGTTVNENATIVIGSGGNGTVTVDVAVRVSSTQQTALYPFLQRLLSKGPSCTSVVAERLSVILGHLAK